MVVGFPENQPTMKNLPKKPQKAAAVSKSCPTGFSFHISTFLGTHINRSGNAPIYLSVIIDRARTKIPLKLSIPPTEFNKATGMVKGSYPAATDFNLIIGQSIAKANDILISARLKNERISRSMFKARFLQGVASGNFVQFMRSQIELRKKELAFESFRSQLGDWSKLCQYRSEISFSEMDFNLIEGFDRHMKTRLFNSPNTRKKTLKTIKTYVRMAIKKEKMVHNPFDQYRVKAQKTEMVYLTRNEVKRLEDLYDLPGLNDSLKLTLQCFLFACFAGGIRISDLQKLNQHNKVKNEIVYVPAKTRETSARIVRVPINSKSRKYLNDSGMLVPCFTSPVMNRHLKSIAALSQIDKRITFHVSRHTFATLFLQSGGKVEVLKELMGHESIKSTMQYVHVTDKSKQEQMAAMEQL